jgi:hypothetical protein
MVMEYLFVCLLGGSNALLSSGESLLQHVLDDPLLALARPGGKSVRHMWRYVSAYVTYRSELSNFARRSLDGAALERDAQEIRSLRYSLLGW